MTQVSRQPNKNWELKEIHMLKHFEDENWKPMATRFTMSLVKQADHLCLAPEMEQNSNRKLLVQKFLKSSHANACAFYNIAMEHIFPPLI